VCCCLLILCYLTESHLVPKATKETTLRHSQSKLYHYHGNQGMKHSLTQSLTNTRILLYTGSETPVLHNPHLVPMKLCELKFPIRVFWHTATNFSDQTLALYWGLSAYTKYNIWNIHNLKQGSPDHSQPHTSIQSDIWIIPNKQIIMDTK
jgi:hypothetical protein